MRRAVVKRAPAWGPMTDRVMQEDTMITAVRGGEAGAIMVPMARGDSEVAEGQPASWHIKVIEKASVKGKIYIGVETMDEKGNHYTRIGEDWYTEKAKDRAFYYSSDGDICTGNVIVQKGGAPWGSGDLVQIQTESNTLTFCKNGVTIGSIKDIKGSVHVSVQFHRPGDKVILLREHLGSAAERDIEKRKEGEKEMELERQKKLRELEEEKQRIAKQKAEVLKQMEEKKRLEAEEIKRLAEEQEAERKNAEIEAERKKVEEEKRREQIEIERKRVEEERRAKLAREEAARKKAAEEQIQKVARSRGGYFEEEQDPDAPTDQEMQRFLRNSLPHRLTAARQMGMPALPGAAAVSQMQIMLTPQQHFAVRTHLTKLNKTARLGRSGGSNEGDETMQSIELAQTLSSPVK